MGGGASKNDVSRLEHELKKKNEEIENLKKNLHEAEEKVSKKKQNETMRPTIVNVGAPGNSEGKPANIPRSRETRIFTEARILESETKAKRDENEAEFSKKKRRVEISAEVLSSAHKDEYEKKVIPKDTAAKECIMKVIQTNILFKGLGQDEVNDCVDAFFKVDKKAGLTIIRQGDQGDNFYVVQEGTLDIFVSVQGNPALKYGELTNSMGFGELALLCNTPRAASILAVTDVTLWALERATFRQICTHYELVRRRKAVQFLRQVSILKKLTDMELEQVAKALEWEKFETGAAIVREGELGDHFYIIESGEVLVTKNLEHGSLNQIRRLGNGDHFGEMALLQDDKRTATCSADGSVHCFTLAREHFTALLGSLKELLDRPDAYQDLPPKQRRVFSVMDNTKYFMDIAFSDLEIIETLGRGAFGLVKLAKHKKTGQTFALKCLIKSVIVNNNLQDHFLNEKKVMLMLDHPFILRLHNTYKDSKYLYFLLEVALGGEIFTHLRKKGRLSESDTRFYVASVVLAFQYMHDRHICYRDLKPENLLLDQQGYLKVADFGLAKVVSERTWTLCGTPDYLAPEIILNKGHNHAVDYWAIGVLIYELIAGYVPFFADDPMEVYHLVLSGNISYPVHFSRPCSDLISKLLTQNPMRRLGNLKDGIKDIIKHKWFAGFDWDGLLNKRLEPPISIQVKDNVDVSNFEYIIDDSQSAVDCGWDPDF